jgi:hypothetical protein
VFVKRPIPRVPPSAPPLNDPPSIRIASCAATAIAKFSQCHRAMGIRGRTNTVHNNADPAGAIHVRSNRPRPADCNSATATKPSAAPPRACSATHRFVESISPNRRTSLNLLMSQSALHPAPRPTCRFAQRISVMARQLSRMCAYGHGHAHHKVRQQTTSPYLEAALAFPKPVRNWHSQYGTAELGNPSRFDARI